MPAVQLTTSSTVMIPASNTAYETIMVENLGPNTIAVDVGQPAVLNSGWHVLAAQSVTFTRPPATAVYGVCATVAQVSPLDTRYMVTV